MRLPHKKSPWFAEKYDPAPEFQNLRTRVRKEGWRGRIDTFLMDLEAGKYDLDPKEQESVGAEPTSTQNGDHGISNGADEGKGQEDDMQFGMYGDDDPTEQDVNKTETNGKGHSQDSRKAPGRGEEVSLMPEGPQKIVDSSVLVPINIGTLTKLPLFS